MLNKLIQNFRWLVKVFSILASTESLVQTLSYFLAFFDLPMVCKLCIFSEVIENLGSNLLVVLFMEGLIRTGFTYSDFFLMCKLCLFDLKIMSFNSDHLRLMSSVNIGGF